MRILTIITFLWLGLILMGCDRLGIPDPAKEEAAKEAEGKATGAACRHAGRAIEDCYTLNPAAHRSSVYSGWKEMNDYMRENKIEEVKPIVVRANASHEASTEEVDDSHSSSASSHAPESSSAASNASH